MLGGDTFADKVIDLGHRGRSNVGLTFRTFRLRLWLQALPALKDVLFLRRRYAHLAVAALPKRHDLSTISHGNHLTDSTHIGVLPRYYHCYPILPSTMRRVHARQWMVKEVGAHERTPRTLPTELVAEQ
jgi:hypothetical protein